MNVLRFSAGLLAALALISSASSHGADGRHIVINGRTLDTSGLAVIQKIEAQTGPVPDGNYWYDQRTGAVGLRGGPVATVIAPGLPFHGQLPANASGGGDGRFTGVFVNGRELHPYDVQRLATIGPVVPGHYWWDAAGNIGLEGGVPLFNFYAAVRARGGSNPYYRSDVSRGESVFVSQGCTSVSGRTSPSDSDSSYSYYVGCD